MALQESSFFVGTTRRSNAVLERRLCVHPVFPWKVSLMHRKCTENAPECQCRTGTLLREFAALSTPVVSSQRRLPRPRLNIGRWYPTRLSPHYRILVQGPGHDLVTCTLCGGSHRLSLKSSRWHPTWLIFHHGILLWDPKQYLETYVFCGGSHRLFHSWNNIYLFICAGLTWEPKLHWPNTTRLLFWMPLVVQ